MKSIKDYLTSKRFRFIDLVLMGLSAVYFEQGALIAGAVLIVLSSVIAVWLDRRDKRCGAVG